jgi:protocatechuate 3,4-dioxygenase beta subunit
MIPSARKTIACILLIFGVAVYSQAQTGPTKETTASISGTVTAKGKGLQGIGVIASLTNSSGLVEGGSYRGTTDHDGKYRITNLPAGTYRFDLFAPTFVHENTETSRTLVIAEGETVENVNFAMLRGGVITGKITNPDGQPVIAEFVFITPVSPHHDHVQYYPGHIATDDRGIYRAFGLRPAKYKVHIGRNEHLLTSRYLRTFHPAVIEEAKATVFEVREGSEIRDVDIVAIRNNTPGYKVSGRIVDGESGKPLANVPYGLMRATEDGRHSMHTNVVTNADGQFTFHKVAPGHYSVFIVREKTEVRAKPTPFEVVDGDVSGLVV